MKEDYDTLFVYYYDGAVCVRVRVFCFIFGLAECGAYNLCLGCKMEKILEHSSRQYKGESGAVSRKKSVRLEIIKKISKHIQ